MPSNRQVMSSLGDDDRFPDSPLALAALHEPKDDWLSPIEAMPITRRVARMTVI
jgi:hypothetical protein